uniref:Ulp1 protease-like n=1 Tax=Oryza glaberrima TaxID=4538 RepID=I1QNN8_ORYGL
MIERHLLTGSQPVKRSDLSYIYFKWSSYDYYQRPARNLRELQLRMPRADKALSDPVETKDHENSIRHCGRLHVSMVLHQDRLRRVRQMLTRLRRRLCAFSITRERLVDLDKEYRMKRWRDESAISDLAGHELEEEGYPVVDYKSEPQTATSTTV